MHATDRVRDRIVYLYLPELSNLCTEISPNVLT